MNKLIVRAQAFLTNRKAEVYVDKAVWIIVGIVIGVVLLVGLSSFFKDTVLVKLQEVIENLFDRADSELGATPTPTT